MLGGLCSGVYSRRMESRFTLNEGFVYIEVKVILYAKTIWLLSEINTIYQHHLSALAGSYV